MKRKQNIPAIKTTIILSLFMCFIQSQLFIKHNLVFASDISINEVLANPQGKDSGMEWIELKNSSKKNIDLDQWSIVQNGKATKIEEKMIKSGDVLVIKLKNIKNNDNQIELKNAQTQLIDTIKYQNAPEGKSLSRLEVAGKIIESWTKPSPGNPNPQYKFITGTGYQASKPNYFKIKTGEEIKKVFYSDITKQLLALLINKDLKLLVQSKGDDYDLSTIKVLPQSNKPAQKEQGLKTILIFLTISFLLYLLLLRNSLSNNPRHFGTR